MRWLSHAPADTSAAGQNQTAGLRVLQSQGMGALRALRRFLGLFLLLAASSAHATIVLPMDVEALTRRSDLVVRGRALSVQPAWSSDGRRIQTTVRVEVASSLKGQAPKVVEIVTPGGVVGEIGQQVSGAPQFAPGEQVIVFLEKVPQVARFQVAGMAQGKFELTADAKGQPIVTQSLAGLAVLGPDGKVREAQPIAPTPEADFVARVQRALRGSAP